MKLVQLKQESEEWLNWRRTHITASDSSSILGINPWKSSLELYEEKVFRFEKEDNEYMRRGRELEPIALESFEQETGLVMFPCVVKHDTILWMGASLDGLSVIRDAIVEIKCNGKKNHDLALDGKIPKHYESQIQHQLACTGLDFSYYYSFDGEKGVILEVKRDEEFIQNMIAKEFEFWQCLQTFTPPTIQPKKRKKKNAAGAVP